MEIILPLTPSQVEALQIYVGSQVFIEQDGTKRPMIVEDVIPGGASTRVVVRDCIPLDPKDDVMFGRAGVDMLKFKQEDLGKPTMKEFHQGLNAKWHKLQPRRRK